MGIIFRGYTVATWLKPSPVRSEPNVVACIDDGNRERLSLRLYHVEAESEYEAKRKARAMRYRDRWIERNLT